MDFKLCGRSRDFFVYRMMHILCVVCTFVYVFVCLLASTVCNSVSDCLFVCVFYYISCFSYEVDLSSIAAEVQSGIHDYVLVAVDISQATLAVVFF